MSLTITHVAGPLAGQSQTFDDQKSRIVFGRNEDICDVVFPGDYNIVAREHFALDRKFAGSYEIDLNKANYVEVDGAQAYENDTIPANCRIRLGGPDGPLIEIAVVQDATADSAPITIKQKTMRRLPDFSRRTRRIAIGLCLAVLVVAAGAVGYGFMKQHEWAELAASIEDVRKNQIENAQRFFTPDVLARLKDSVYLVVMRDKVGKETGIGTAFAIEPTVLATNAHVVDYLLLQPGFTFHVSILKNGSVKKFPIIKAVMHPGFKRFKQFSKNTSLVVLRADGKTRKQTFVPAYDVALLHVAASSGLDPYLKIANDKTLHELAAGDPVAYAGFPMENLMGVAALALAPEPQLKTGVLTSTTNFFSFPTRPAERQLLRHDMGSAGGASGSPIINSKGEVVGAHNAGTYFHLPAKSGAKVEVLRVPHAASINFAQRADLIKELLSGTAAKRLVGYQKSWVRDAAKFATWQERVLASLAKQWRFKAKGKKPKTVIQEDGTLRTLRFDFLGFGARRNINLKKGRYGFHAVASRQNDINLFLRVGGKIVKSDTARHSFPNFHYQFQQDTPVEIVVTSPKKRNVKYRLEVLKLD